MATWVLRTAAVSVSEGVDEGVGAGVGEAVGAGLGEELPASSSPHPANASVKAITKHEEYRMEPPHSHFDVQQSWTGFVPNCKLLIFCFGQ
jgi:hypothetical protein